jgi:hypothetical protein
MIARREFIKGAGAVGISSTVFVARGGAQPAARPVVKGVYAAPGLSFSAIFLAGRLDLWTKNGVTAEMKQVQGGPLSMVALTNREASFAGVASTDPVVGWEKGIKTLSIAAFTGSLAMQFTARKDWMSRVEEYACRQAKGIQRSAHRRFHDRRRPRAIHALSGTNRWN